MSPTLIIKIILLFLSRWFELNKERRTKKKELNREMVNAFKETDKKIRASRLSAVVSNINRL